MAALLAEVLDAADRADDHVRTVVGLAGGRLGGGATGGRSWLARRLAGEGRVAAGFARRYGPDQLHKAARDADELLDGVEGLRATGECEGLVTRLDELGVRHLADRLRSVPPGGPELDSLGTTLSAIRGEVVRARIALALGERRHPPAPSGEPFPDQDG